MAAAARIDYAALRPLLGDAEKGLVMIGRAARAEGLDPALLELVDLRASQLNGCAYCVQTRTNKARKPGIEWARSAQLATWPESPLFSDREGTALALTEALTRIDPAHGVPDALHDRAAQEFGPQALAALTGKILGIDAWNRLMIAYRITPPASEE
jgi:AhpD family alkylhydroperoxidase